MTKNRTRTRILGLIQSLLICATAAAIVVPAMSQEIGPASARVEVDRTPAPGEVEVHDAIADGSCWAGGEGHPYPTSVWVKVRWSGSGDVKYVLRGARYTDALLADSSRWDEVAAFCR